VSAVAAATALAGAAFDVDLQLGSAPAPETVQVSGGAS
jgi:hypothetical protein